MSEMPVLRTSGSASLLTPAFQNSSFIGTGVVWLTFPTSWTATGNFDTIFTSAGFHREIGISDKCRYQEPVSGCPDVALVNERQRGCDPRIVVDMKIRVHFAAAIVLLTVFTAAAQAPNKLTPQEQAAGWHLLFDGTTSTGWRSTKSPAFPTTGWEVKNGLLSVTEHGGEEGGNAGDIMTVRKYTNFELSVDFRITPGANSGIKYFVDLDLAPGHDGHGSNVGFEYQVLDDALHPDGKKGKNGDRTVASLYDMIPAATDKPVHAVGQWNTARIVVQGTHGEHWLNGVKVLEYDRATPAFRAIVADSKFHVYPNFGEANGGYILL